MGDYDTIAPLLISRYLRQYFFSNNIMPKRQSRNLLKKKQLHCRIYETVIRYLNTGNRTFRIIYTLDMITRLVGSDATKLASADISSQMRLLSKLNSGSSYRNGISGNVSLHATKKLHTRSFVRFIRYKLQRFYMCTFVRIYVHIIQNDNCNLEEGRGGAGMWKGGRVDQMCHA